MYRRKYLHGCCLSCLGFGLILGHSLESWLVCCGGGAALLLLGLCSLGKKQ